MDFYYHREELDGMDLITIIPKYYWNEHQTIQDFSVSELDDKMIEYGGFECMEGCYEADDMDDFERLLRDDPDFEENTELGYKYQLSKKQDKELIIKKCGCCGKTFEKTPYEFPLNAVFETDDFEVRWDLKDIIRKSDRKMILSVENWDSDNIILCVECYDKITNDIIERIKSGKILSSINKSI